MSTPKSGDVDSAISTVLCSWNRRSSRCREAAAKLLDLLRGAGFEVEERDDDAPGEPSPVGRHVDAIVLLGGDGFLLESLHSLDYPPIPVFGLNYGSVGFLMNRTDCLERMPELLRGGELREEVHSILEAEIVTENGRAVSLLAFNDFVVERMSRQSVRLSVSLDGDAFNQYAGDGFVISSTAGSTAYNLAAGGPVIHPGVPAMVLAPLYPHRAVPFTSMQFPLVIPLTSELDIEVLETEKRKTRVVADGRAPVRANRVRVRDSGKVVRLLRRPGQAFVRTLERKIIGG